MTQPDAPRPRPRPGPGPASPAAPRPPMAPAVQPALPAPSSPDPASAQRGNSDTHPANAHRTLMAVLVTVALILAGVVVWLVVRTDTVGTRRVALPVRFTDYVRADRDSEVVHAVRGLLPASVASGAAGGGYSRDTGSGPTPLAVVVVSAAGLAGSGASVDTFPDLVARNAGPAPYVTGIDNGTLICGPVVLAGAARTVCGWGDSRTSGVFVASAPQPTPAELAEVVKRFLDEVER